MSRLGRRAAIVTLLAATACGSSGHVDTISWSEASPRSGVVVGDTVRIDGSEAGGTYPLIAYAPARPLPSEYALEGQVRYEGVEGDGYLELWSYFPDDSRYFSRTLAPSGPQGVLSGTSGWRSFALPFSTNGGPAPSRLDLDVVLPGSGTVTVGPVHLVELSDVAWWSDRTAGAIGGGAGALIGVLGAIIGVLAARRRGRGAVLATMKVLSACGAGLVAIGVIAVIRDQPYAVVFPLFLLGTILVAVFGGGYRSTRRTYEAAELRKMQAMDRTGA
jgi:hypothetical protein